LLALLGSAPARGQQRDVQFVLLGKTANHRQTAGGELRFLNTTLFGEVFLLPGGRATNAWVEGPGDAATGMRFGDGEVLFFAAGRYGSVAELDAHFPDGTYYFNFDTPSGDVRELPVVLSKRGAGSRHPDPIEITFYQDGAVTPPGAVDPDRDLRVSFSPFEKGAADPNGIIDDMIYVIVGDCLGEKIVHSGHAFEEGALTYASRDFVVPRASLGPGEVFQLEVEFSEMDTGRERGLTTIVTHAASTFLDFRTTGTALRGRRCPAEPYAMDGGQTDRVRRPE
jgi:hypothetical protein